MTPYADAETLFEATIDGNFPYDNADEAARLIQESRSISSNAVFCVLDEICRPPELGIVTQDRQRDLIANWASGFEHPLKEGILRCAEALVSAKLLPWNDAVSAIEYVGRFDAQRAALSIAYFSGDSMSDEGDAALSEAESRIRRSWDDRGI